MALRRRHRSQGFFIAACGLVWIVCSWLVACAPEAPRPRGVVLISLDTLRADRLGFQGYERPTSPFLDSLAARSLVFDDAISQAPWTGPAHASMLTSMYPSTLGLGAYPRAGRVPERAVAIAEVLREAGFRTHAETGGGFLARGLGFAQGFESYEDRPRPFSQSVERAAAWLAEIGPGQRFFLFLHTYDIHGFDPPRWARSELMDARQLPPDLARLLAAAMKRGAHGLAELLQNPIHARAVQQLQPETRVYLSQLYDASIRAVDRQLARLLEELGELGLLEETLLVITSDHGEELFDHGRTGHGFTLFRENLRVPLLLSHPTLAPGRIARTVQIIDLAPTIVELLGVPVPSDWQGRSLLGESLQRLAFSEGAHRPLRAVQGGAFKLIRAESGADGWLFDLRSDPAETRNLIGQGEPMEAALRGALDSWQRDNVLRQLQAPGAMPPLGDEISRQLEALGYLDPNP